MFHVEHFTFRCEGKDAMAETALIFGSKGMLARALAEELRTRGVDFAGYDLPECDLTRCADAAAIFETHSPHVVFNCAAFTKVDLCEEKRELADAVNGYAVDGLAELAKEFGAKLIHISTDFVFDGQSRRPYLPDDTPAPLSAYGRSKLLGEQLLQEVDPPGWAIIRTAWLYGIAGASFPRTMVELARQGKPLRVVNDQVGCPTYTRDLAAAMVDVAQHDAAGIFHCTNSGPTNWYEFAAETLRQFGLQADLAPTTTADYLKTRPQQAIRPLYSVLDCRSLEAAIGRSLRPWQSALKDFVASVQESGSFQ